MSDDAPSADNVADSPSDSMLTGDSYLASLDDGREVWYDGEKVDDNVASHPAFANASRTVASLYDALHSPATADTLTAVDRFGNRTHRFFAPSYSSDDLRGSRAAIATSAVPGSRPRSGSSSSS